MGPRAMSPLHGCPGALSPSQCLPSRGNTEFSPAAPPGTSFEHRHVQPSYAASHLDAVTCRTLGGSQPAVQGHDGMHLPGVPRPAPLQPPPCSQSFPTPTERTLSSPPWICCPNQGAWGGDRQVWPEGLPQSFCPPASALFCSVGVFVSCWKCRICGHNVYLSK